MLWTLQELIQLVKDDLGLRDLPSAITDQALLNRFKSSCLKEFSVICPRLETFNMGRDDLVDPPQSCYAHSTGIKYKVPAYFIKQGMVILAVTNIEPLRMSGYADCMWPGIGFDPFGVMESVVSIQAAAAVGQNVTSSLTYHWDSLKNEITLYHGWSTISYKVTVTVCHDLSLSTVPPTAAPALRKLAKLDLGEYIYNELKRKNNIDTGAGNITLNIDELADYGRQKEDYLRELSEDANLDVDSITFF